MTVLKITAGGYKFIALMEEKKAPKTCQAFKKLLPFKNRIIHVRWSGEAVWVPLGDFGFVNYYENHTSHPSKGEIIVYPGGISETEIFIPYGSTSFSSKVGQLAGNHFLTIIEGNENLANLGEDVLWKGAQDIIFEE